MKMIPPLGACMRRPRHRTRRGSHRFIDALWRAGARTNWLPFRCAVCGWFHLTSAGDTTARVARDEKALAR